MYILTLQLAAVDCFGITTEHDPDETEMLLGTIPKMLAYGSMTLSVVMAVFVNVNVTSADVLSVFVCSMYFVPLISVYELPMPTL